MVSGKAALLLGFIANFAYGSDQARFHPADAKEVDVEDLDGEVYTDIFSFRFFQHWNKRFEEATFGFRQTNGSLDINHFSHSQQIKASYSPPEGWLQLAYDQYEQEYRSELLKRQELQVRFRTLGYVYLGIMGYSAHEKEWGDLGALLHYHENTNRKLTVYYLSIDHYYNEKKGVASDRYTRRPWEAGLRLLWSQKPLRLHGHYFYSSPMRWRRQSEGYTYNFFRTQAKLRADYSPNERWELFFETAFDRKAEAKGYHPDLSAPKFKKDLNRKILKQHLGVIFDKNKPNYYVVGLWSQFRDAKYTYDQLDASQETPEPVDPSLRRSDLLLYGNYTHAFNLNHSLRTGLILARVERKRTGSHRKTGEAKPTLSWEMKIKENGFLALNSTLDLDEMVSQYPYKDGFPGWDGGGFAIMVVF